MNKFMLLLLPLASCSTPTVPGANQNPVQSQGQAAGQARAPIDAKNGFRTYHFGDDLASIPDLQPLQVPHPAEVQVYKRDPAKENLKMGDGKLSFIRYDFYQGKLYQVMLVADRANAPQLLAAAKALYGPGTQANPEEANYTWAGESATGSYQRVPGSGIAALTLSSTSALTALAADQARAGKQATNDL